MYLFDNFNGLLKMTEEIIVVSNTSIGDYFRKLRENTGFNQSDVSRHTKVSQQLISMLEKNGIRSGTRWNGVTKLLEFYAQNGSPSLFALIYQNGQLIEKFPEVYLGRSETKEEIVSFKEQLKDLLQRLEDVDL